MEWIPSEEEYNPGIAKEQWIEFIQDKNIFNENALITFACIQKAKVSSCGDMAEEFGRSLNFYNSNVWRTGERIFKKTNCPLSERDVGSDRFWSICCLGKYEKQPDGHSRFIYKIRPELQEAFDETGVLEGVEVMEKKTSFTWIPFYTEMAEKLLEYKDNRKELVKIVYGMDRQFVNYIKDDVGNDYPDIDPFSVFAIFNRKITDERRKDVCKYFKNVLELDSDIPEDFDSIPVMNPQLSVFVCREEISTGIQPIWDLYSIVFENNYNSEKFLEHFNIVRNQRGIKWTLTMALYWIRPYEFMPLDANSREYLQKIGINVFDEKELNGQNYLDLCELIKDKIANNEIKEKSIPEISNNAWLKEPQGDTQMAQEDTLVKKYANLLKNTKNLILTGAPGTGKTYLAKQIAKELGCKDDNIGFVQFHPSYDYTDFVEGLRPTDKDGNGNVGFERKDGVFKEFCERALKNLVDSRKSAKQISSEKSILEKLENFLDNAIDSNREFLLKNGNNFYIQSYDEKWIIGNVPNNKEPNIKISKIDVIEILERKVELKDVKDVRVIHLAQTRQQQDSYVFVLCNEIKSDDLFSIDSKTENSETIPQKNFVFIIDEINRGEVAKIFGELFYSVDTGYRVTANSLEKAEGETITTIRTQYANMEKSQNEFDRALNSSTFGHFFIPENVYIIGTMNDIDRSVESMDFAFRRRFTWAEVKAKDTQYMLDAELDAVLADEAKRRMENLNSAISEIEGLNEAYHIGASYFLKLKNYNGDFESLWEYHIKGILQEYLRGNPNAQEELEKLKAAYDREEEK